MPNLITHIVIGGEALKRLPVPIRELASKCKEAFTLGSIGPDFLFVLRELGLPPKRLPNRMHGYNQFETFEAIISHIKDNPSDVLTSYVLGLSVHYALDSTVHPYVYAMCEGRVRNMLDDISRVSTHSLIESALDEYLLERVGVNPTNAFNASKALKSSKSQRREIGTLYERAIGPLYGIDITPSQVDFGFEMTRVLLEVLQDRTGARKKIMRGVEKTVLGGKRKMTSLAHPPYKYGEIDYLNFDRTSFRAVRNRPEEICVTCPELLDTATEKAVNIYLPTIYSAIIDGKELPRELFEVSYDGTVT